MGDAAITNHKEMAAYAALLALQTVAATFLFWLIFPIFRQIVTRIGEPTDLTLFLELAIVGGTVLLHCAYWARLRWVAVRIPFRSVFVGHLIQFAGRASFFFGGALFSAIFFRHLPELESVPTEGQWVMKAALVMWVLFALFCYSLELDRLGKAIEG